MYLFTSCSFSLAQSQSISAQTISLKTEEGVWVAVAVTLGDGVEETVGVGTCVVEDGVGVGTCVVEDGVGVGDASGAGVGVAAGTSALHRQCQINRAAIIRRPIPR